MNSPQKFITTSSKLFFSHLIPPKPLSPSRPYSVGVIGAPFWAGQSHPAMEQSPDALRGVGLLNQLQLIKPDLVDFGNLHFGLAHAHSGEMMHSSIRLQNRAEFVLAQMCAQLSHVVATAVQKGYVPLTLGGDHSIAVGSVMGTSSAQPPDQELSLIWIGAHADINTEKSSKSGNLNGMPVSFLLKNIVDAPRRDLFENLKPCLNSANVAYIGLRNVEPQELAILKQLNIAYYSMRDVDRLGINEVISRALAKVNPTGRNKLHVSFDVGALDNSIMPSTETPGSGGLTVREALVLGEAIDATGQLAAFDLVEFNPEIGSPEQVAHASKYIVDIVLSFFGKSRLGYYHKSEEVK